MRLTWALCIGVGRKVPHGFQYRGKHRKLRPLTVERMWEIRANYERMERNMLILRHPYLTIEQSRNHMDHIDKKQLFYDQLIIPRNEKFSEKSTTLAEKLDHLRVTEAWD